MLRFLAIVLVFVAIVIDPVQAQTLSTKSKKAIELYKESDNFRVRGQLKQAVDLLHQAIKKDRKFVEAYHRLGIIYLSMKDYPNAIEHLEKGLGLTNDIRKQKLFWFDLAEGYFSIGQYDKAEKFITDFLREEKGNVQRRDKAARLLTNIEFAQKNKAKEAAYRQRILSDTVNRFVMQYFPVLTADQQEMIFTRRLGRREADDEDLVVSRKDAHGRWGIPQSISDSINSELNEGTCTISADGRKLIFTSCAGRDGYGSCDLFQSHKTGDSWSTPRNLGPNVNTSDWESQPSLSADGRTLYFVSDRPGGVGRRDIWVSTLNDEGEWTRAVNLGKSINTPYDEISPFIHVNNRTLYFASNGHTGFGGYDIFYSEKDLAGGWGNPVNIGGPVNNHDDQFSLFITADGKKGYYSYEERLPDGHSCSRIVEIDIPEEDRIRFKSNYVKGTVRDNLTKQPLGAHIELINLERNEVESIVRSDSVSGSYLIVLTQGAEYALYISKKGYLFKSLNFNYSEIEDFEPIILDIDLEKVKEGSTAVLQNIFFDHNKYELKEKSRTELQKVIRFLTENPGVKIEISGHTDNVGSEAYNQQLSEKRAEAVFVYLTKHNIDPSRVVVQGYGATRPRADNDTEEGRSLNRRIEFRIIN